MARSYSRDELAVRRTLNQSVVPVLDAHGRSRIRLHTLGAAVMLAGDVRIDPSAGTSFSVVLRLAYSPGMHVARDVLLRELWPGQQPTRQRANLRQALYKLRQLGVNAALIGDTVGLDVSQVDHTFSLARTAEQFERDVICGHEPFGPFLPGYVAAWPDFGEWLEITREAVHADVRRVLVGQLRSRRERADWGGAEALARWLVQFDPLNEDATLTIAECTALAGAKSEAVAILDRYLAEVGATAGDIRLPALLLRRRIAEPVARGRLSFAPTERHFIGREEELAALTLLMRRTRWHDGCVVLVHGPPGMGKTRLTEELAKVATIEGFRTVRMGCREGDADRPFSIFLDAAPDLMVLPGALGCAPDNLAVLKRWVPSWRQQANETDPPEWTKVSLDDVEEPRVQRPYPSAASLRRALLDLLAAVSDEKPLLVVIDDTHWIDDASWAVLADLAERAGATRTFAVMTSREPHPRATRPERVPGALQVRPLHPISPESSLALAIAIGEDLSAPIPDALADWFVRAGEGVPLFLRSLVNHWIESGEAGGVPPTLGELIEQRLGKLSGDAVVVLQAASILGDRADVSLLERVLDMRAFEILRATEELQRGDALADRGECKIAVHELLARAAVARLGPTSTRILHRRIAVALEATENDRPTVSEILYVLFSWRAAQEWVAFTEYFLRHSLALIQVGDGRTLLDLVICAIDRCGEVHRDALLSIRRQAELDCGLPPVTNRSLVISSASLARDAASPHPAAIIELLVQIESAFRADPVADRNQMVVACCAISGNAALNYPLRLRAADVGIRIASNMCSPVFAAEVFGSVQDALENSADEDKTHAVEIAYHAIFGDLDRAENLARLLLESVKHDEPSTGRYHKLCRAAYALRITGDWGLSVDGFQAAIINAEQENTSALLLYPRWQLSVLALERGDLAEAITHTDKLRRSFEVNPNDFAAHYVFSHFARMALECGEIRRLDDAVQLSAQHLRKSPAAKSFAYQAALELAAATLRNDTARVSDRTLLDVAIRRHEGTASFGTSDFLTATIVGELMQSGKRDEASTFLQTYLNSIRRDRGTVSAGLSRLSSPEKSATKRKPAESRQLDRTQG